MQKAVYNLWGSEHISVRVLYSIGQGYYCELREKADGQERVIAVDEERAIALKKEMYRLVTEFTTWRLGKKALSGNLNEYDRLNYIDETEQTYIKN